MKRLLMLLMMLVTPLSAEAVLYSWTDAAGTVHATDDPGSIPKKYRRKSKQSYGADTASPAVAPPAGTTGAGKEAPVAVQPAPAGTTLPVVPPAAGGSARYGDRTAGEWQAEFRALREQIREIDRQFEQARREGGDGKTAISRQKIDELNALNKRLNEESTAVRLRFNQLVEQANKVGLPPEFAQ